VRKGRLTLTGESNVTVAGGRATSHLLYASFFLFKGSVSMMREQYLDDKAGTIDWHITNTKHFLFMVNHPFSLSIIKSFC
jgi:hypothetical protein